jgi:hypothetical protein
MCQCADAQYGKGFVSRNFFQTATAAQNKSEARQPTQGPCQKTSRLDATAG